MAKKKPAHDTFTMRLTEDVRDALTELAMDDGRSLANYCENLLRLHVKEQGYDLTSVPPQGRRARSG